MGLLLYCMVYYIAALNLRKPSVNVKSFLGRSPRGSEDTLLCI